MKTLAELAYEANYDINELSHLVTQQGLSNYSTTIEILGVDIKPEHLAGTGLQLDTVYYDGSMPVSYVYSSLFANDLDSMMESTGEDNEYSWILKGEAVSMMQPLILDLLKNIK